MRDVRTTLTPAQLRAQVIALPRVTEEENEELLDLFLDRAYGTDEALRH